MTIIQMSDYQKPAEPKPVSSPLISKADQAEVEAFMTRLYGLLAEVPQMRIISAKSLAHDQHVKREAMRVIREHRHRRTSLTLVGLDFLNSFTGPDDAA